MNTDSTHTNKISSSRRLYNEIKKRHSDVLGNGANQGVHAGEIKIAK